MIVVLSYRFEDDVDSDNSSILAEFNNLGKAVSYARKYAHLSGDCRVVVVRCGEPVYIIHRLCEYTVISSSNPSFNSLVKLTNNLIDALYNNDNVFNIGTKFLLREVNGVISVVDLSTNKVLVEDVFGCDSSVDIANCVGNLVVFFTSVLKRRVKNYMFSFRNSGAYYFSGSRYSEGIIDLYLDVL